MKSKLYCKLIAVGIIVLFMGVSVSSAKYINETSNSENDIKSKDVDTSPPEIIRFAFIWGDIAGGTHMPYYRFFGQCFRATFYGTIHIYEILTGNKYTLGSLSTAEFRGFRGIVYLFTPSYPDPVGWIKGYVRYLNRNPGE